MEPVTYKLQDWRQKATESAKTASDQVRSLSLGGLAIIWAFKPPVDPAKPLPVSDALAAAIPPLLRFAAFCFIAALILDILQYLLNAVMYGVFTSRKLKQGKNAGDEVATTKLINVPHRICFFGKLIALALGMGILAVAFFPNTFGGPVTGTEVLH